MDTALCLPGIIVSPVNPLLYWLFAFRPYEKPDQVGLPVQDNAPSPFHRSQGKGHAVPLIGIGLNGKMTFGTPRHGPPGHLVINFIEVGRLFAVVEKKTENCLTVRIPLQLQCQFKPAGREEPLCVDLCCVIPVSPGGNMKGEGIIFIPGYCFGTEIVGTGTDFSSVALDNPVKTGPVDTVGAVSGQLCWKERKKQEKEQKIW